MPNPDICPVCYGKGRVWREHPDGGHYTITCWRCGGKGYLNPEEHDHNPPSRKEAKDGD